jgi:hypothetical protein
LRTFFITTRDLYFFIVVVKSSKPVRLETFSNIF